MVTEKEKIAAELSKAKFIWKDLVNKREPDVKKLSEIFARYKKFLAENKNLIGREGGYLQEVDMVETLLAHYHEVTAGREKRMLLNDAYLGLMFNVSESIDELKSQMEEEAIAASEQSILN